MFAGKIVQTIEYIYNQLELLQYSLDELCVVDEYQIC